MKLGKLAPQDHPKTLLFSKYATGELPEPSAKVYREYKVPLAAKQFFGNSWCGDCVWAALANAIILMTSHTGKIVIPTITDVLKGYSDVTGFDPKTNKNDNGTVFTDALAYMQTTGIAGHKILAWAKIDHTNLQHRRLAVDLFGCTLVGVQLPGQAQTQFAQNKPWEVVPKDHNEGGHAILHPGYGSEGGDYVSWARWDQKASSAWESTYIDEEYVVISENWINQATQKTPGGLDLAALEADIKLL